MGNNIKRIYLFSIVFLTVTLLKGPGLADDKARDRSTLKGIQAVVVIVHAVAPEWQAELAKVGLSESALQATVEQQLQKAGIRVVAEEAASRSEFEGILNVRLSFAGPEPAKKQFPALGQKEETIEKVDVKKRYVYAIRLNLRQLVSLKRDPAAEAFSITWQTESVGMRHLSLIQERIKSLVDVFIEAYASENPDLINR